jgi:hypothetical protein
MEVLAAALLAGACAGLTALAIRWRSRRGRAAVAATAAAEAVSDAPARDQLEDLRLEDLVLYEGLELRVAGLARCEERELRWCEVRLLDGDTERWLLMRPEDPDAAAVGQRLADLGLGPQPSEALEHDGKVYQLERCGQAQASAEGDLAGVLTDAGCGYLDYRRPGPDRLWIRHGPRGTTCFGGQRVGRHLLCVLPAS